jgi:acid phosphatase family membrane protein YuiD
MPFLRDVVTNDILWISIIASTLAQFFKPLTYYWRTREFDWHHITETGGLPSSHSALVTALATGLGIEQGFGSPFFAIAVVLTMIVTYDAQGVRRQAGEHARALNVIFAELLSGHEVSEEHLSEVLGHSRIEVFAGMLFGIVVMLLWKLIVQALFK